MINFFKRQKERRKRERYLDCIIAIILIKQSSYSYEYQEVRKIVTIIAL